MDKSGIYVCLRLLEILPVLKVVFFSREETGCVGSNAFNKTFLKNCRFIGGVDRRGIEDFVTSYHSKVTVSEEFLTDVKPLLTKYSRKESVGMVTDALSMNYPLASFNMSAAYYDPHTSTETVIVNELEATLNFCLDIAKTCTKVYPYTRPVSSYYDYNTPTYRHNFNNEKFMRNYTRTNNSFTRELFPNQEEDFQDRRENDWDKVVDEHEKEWRKYYDERFDW